MINAPILSILSTRKRSGAASYSNTAFVSPTGNDGTALLNSIDNPYATTDLALTDLASLYPSEPVTVRYLGNIATGTAVSIPATITGAITLKGHDAAYTTDEPFSKTDSTAIDLTLDNLSLTAATSLAWPDHADTAVHNAGHLRGLNTAVIAYLRANGANGSTPGSTGAAGNSSQTGTNGADGAAGDPPESGYKAPDLVCNGESGGVGSSGGFGRSFEIWGTLVITAGSVAGGAGAEGGGGGQGGSNNVGGTGGLGGDAAGSSTDGASGGEGGDVYAHGGSGGDGGTGGDGGSIIAHGSANGSAIVRTGGGGGSGGSGGTAGNSNAGGSGGPGGAANGGSAGGDGGTGTVYGDAGASGAIGTSGANGTYTPP